MNIVVIFILTVIPLPAAVITQWNFNSIVNDVSTTSGTMSPSIATVGDTWYNSRSIDLFAISLLGKNPNSGVRIASAFESTATGIGAVS